MLELASGFAEKEERLVGGGFELGVRQRGEAVLDDFVVGPALSMLDALAICPS